MNGWSKWFQDNFDKLLLALIFAGCAALVVHMAHDGRDTAEISWAREITGTVLGALLGLITGHALASKATSSGPGGASAQVETK